MLLGCFLIGREKVAQICTKLLGSECLLALVPERSSVKPTWRSATAGILLGGGVGLSSRFRCDNSAMLCGRWCALVRAASHKLHKLVIFLLILM